MLLLSIIFMELNINLSVNHIFANDDVGAFGKKLFWLHQAHKLNWYILSVVIFYDKYNNGNCVTTDMIPI